jgi:hypothetical protein
MDRTSRRYVEALYPYGMVVAAGYVASKLSITTPTYLDDKGISLPSFFSNLLNVEFFAAGIMFSVFVFTMAPAAGFIAKLERLGLYSRFRRYTLEAVALGVVGSALCIPLAIMTPMAMQKWPVPLLTVAAVGIAIGFFASVFRVVRIFYVWTKQV